MHTTTPVELCPSGAHVPVHTDRTLTIIPADWPSPGLIDLELHDRPHGSSTKEWWYLNTHLVAADGRQLSIFASFFRMAVGHDAATGQTTYAHSVAWALSDPATGRYLLTSLLDRSAPDVALRHLESGDAIYDPRVRRALREILRRGEVPLPDRLFSREVQIAEDRLTLDFDGNRLARRDDGSYDLRLVAPQHGLACALRFTLEKPVVRHGDDGVVRGASNEDMFYYFSPRCHVEGTLTLDGSEQGVSGSGWYDHEFGRMEHATTGDLAQGTVAWNWVSAQLDNGCEISAYDLFDVRRGGESCGRWAILIGPDGLPNQYDDFVFTPLEAWVSSRTFNSYPTRWRLAIPAADIELEVTAAFGAQEFITIISPPAFWEGRVELHGMMGGQPVAGPGFVERSGFDDSPDLGRFLHAVGRETQRVLAELLPLTPTKAEARRLLSGPASAHDLDGVDVGRTADVLIRPIRDILDRGGKSWRSYGLLASIDVVGGDSQPFMRWLAVPELLHVGSLIVDDVQDRSTVRRGGPACHLVYGEPLAINAGTAAYFLGQPLLHEVALPAATQVHVYNLYFEALRAAHAGQALDIAGLDHLMPEVIERGDSAKLEQQLLGIHRFKAAVPPRALARMGGHVGGGTDAQIAALSDFFEQLGVAFQIVDDVLNLRGFKGELKNRGEDLAHGKVTMPVAKAMGRLPLAERQTLWETIVGRPTDPAVIGGLIAQLEACGAVDACVMQAEALIESAWARLDPLVPPSFSKVMLRAFSWYVLERVY